MQLWLGFGSPPREKSNFGGGGGGDLELIIEPRSSFNDNPISFPPLRFFSQVQVRPQASSLAPDSSPVSILSPGLTVMTPDVEMASLGLTDKTSPCVKNSMVEVP